MKKNGKKYRKIHKKKECAQVDKEINALIEELENAIQKDKRKIVIFNNAKIELMQSDIDEYKKLGISLTEQYLREIWDYHSVYFGGKIQNEMSQLIKYDLSYRFLFMKSRLGSIIYYNSQGKEERHFDTFVEFYDFARNNSNFTYGFENIQLQGGVSRNKIKFFGIYFLPLYDQMSWKNLCITALVYWIKWIKKWERTKSTICFDDPFYKERIGNLSFDEYCQQMIKNNFFALGYTIYNSIGEMNNLRQRLGLDKQEYTDNIEMLLSRYSYNGKALFEKVDCLANYKNCIGIYMFCLSEIRGIYIGQTRNNIQDRIKAHWSYPSNHFDCTFGPNDVDEIYVIKVPVAYLNDVERDCIAMVKKKYILNGLRGGGIMETVHSQVNRREDYLLKDDHLLMIKEQIIQDIHR